MRLELMVGPVDQEPVQIGANGLAS
jgi:hypothetical protein